MKLTVDENSPTPPFEQLRLQVLEAVRTGAVAPGDKLPTVRRLADELGLAPNTVARAYRELEADEVIATHGRRGTFVRSEVVDDPTIHSSTADTARAAAADYVQALRRLGLSSPEALRLVENAWHQGGFTRGR